MKLNKSCVDGHLVSYSSSWIYDLENENHFNWYWHQAKIVYDYCTIDDKILEIGIGTGLLSDILKKRNWNVKTLDIDEEKNPDFCNNALDFNYINHNFNVILAFEVFEHIPFSSFKKIINKIAFSKPRAIYFSIPYCEYNLLNASIKTPFFSDININLSIPKNNINTTNHHWELSNNIFNKNDNLVKVKILESLFNNISYSLKKTNKSRYIQFFEAKII